MINSNEIETVSTMYGTFNALKGDLITEQLKQYSAHTRNEVAMLASTLSAGETVIDVGAHIGTFSIPMASMVGPSGKVYAFEASLQNYELLKRNIKVNQLSNTVTAYQAVVASASSSFYKEITPNDSNSGMCYFIEDESGNIRAINLDTWISENGIQKVDLVKIDVEGAEVQVLESCRNLLESQRPNLYIEVSQNQLKRFARSKRILEAILLQNGYHFFTNVGDRNSSNDSFKIVRLESLAEIDNLFDVLCIHPNNSAYQKINALAIQNTKIKGGSVEKIENLFLSVGAMKAGTTWLYEQLKDHPEIHFTPEKEIHYFANAVGIENQLNHRNRIVKLKEVLEKTAHGNPKFISNHLEEISWYSEYARPRETSAQWYRNLFRFNNNKKYCADFSNLYCQMSTDGWSEVRKTARNVKVIYTLRDPMKRLWSHYKFHMKWVNREDDALDAGFEHFKKLLDQNFFWVNAEYSRNYKRLKESLHENELMLLYFEDFRAHPARMLEEIHQFLNIEKILPDEALLTKKVNQTKGFEMPVEWQSYARTKLSPIFKEMKALSINHESWNL